MVSLPRTTCTPTAFLVALPMIACGPTLVETDDDGSSTPGGSSDTGTSADDESTDPDSDTQDPPESTTTGKTGNDSADETETEDTTTTGDETESADTATTDDPDTDDSETDDPNTEDPMDDLPHTWDCTIEPGPGEVVGCAGWLRVLDGEVERIVDLPVDDPYVDALERLNIELRWQEDGEWKYVHQRVTDSGHFRFTDVPEGPVLIGLGQYAVYHDARKFDFLNHDTPAARTHSSDRLDVRVEFGETTDLELPFSVELVCPGEGSIGHLYAYDDEDGRYVKGRISPLQFPKDGGTYSGCSIWPAFEPNEEAARGWMVALEDFELRPGEPLMLRGDERTVTPPPAIAIDWAQDKVGPMLREWSEGARLHQAMISYDQFMHPGQPEGSGVGDSVATRSDNNFDGTSSSVIPPAIPDIGSRGMFFYHELTDDESSFPPSFAAHTTYRRYDLDNPPESFDLSPTLALPSDLSLNGSLLGPFDANLPDALEELRFEYAPPGTNDEGEPISTYFWFQGTKGGITIVRSYLDHTVIPDNFVAGFDRRIVQISHTTCARVGRPAFMPERDCESSELHFRREDDDDRSLEPSVLPRWSNFGMSPMRHARGQRSAHASESLRDPPTHQAQSNCEQ